MKKKKITFDEAYDFILIVINSYARDYRLCWEINRLLNISLKKETTGENKSFAGANPLDRIESPSALFCFDDEERRINYTFFSNKTDNGKIIKELRTTDYLMKIVGHRSSQMADFAKKTVTKIRSIPMITMAYIADSKKLK